jgi:hypothetical protein
MSLMQLPGHEPHRHPWPIPSCGVGLICCAVSFLWLVANEPIGHLLPRYDCEVAVHTTATLVIAVINEWLPLTEDLIQGFSTA